MYIKNVHFENERLNANWYNGLHRIHEIHFQYCTIDAIEENAFNIATFVELIYFAVKNNNRLITFHDGCFNGLNRIANFMFDHSALSRHSIGILNDLSKSIETIRLTQITTDIGLAHFLETNTSIIW